jgi:DNA-binding transcriptional LysR family regulator
MNIDHLRKFLCVAETLNFTHAADRRNTTQSNLGKRLRGLEDYLGRALIDRGNRPLCLTKAGDEFVPVARQVLSVLDSFRGQSIPLSPSEGGVSIVIPHSVTFTVFLKFKEWLSHRMMGAHFAPLLANDHTAARMIARSETDLAIVPRHPRVPLDENWSVLRYADIA